jgi:nitrile hydratase accessory protein
LFDFVNADLQKRGWKEVAAGRQAYVVYPLIEESEKVDLKAATEMADNLAQEVLYVNQKLMKQFRYKVPTTWQEWAATLGAEIKRAQAAGDPDTGETYYRHWLNALERLIAEKGITDGATLARYQNAWHQAAGRTPHGSPIELRPEDFSQPR